MVRLRMRLLYLVLQQSVLLLAWQAVAQSITVCMLGTSGAGKSTMITHSFDIAGVRVGDIKSTTTQVHRYQAGPGALPFLQGSVVFDTPGLRDTEGITDRELLRQVTHFYLKQRQTNDEDLIDVFLVLVPTTLPRVYIHQDLGVYLSAFSPEMLRSTVVVITQNNIARKVGAYIDAIGQEAQDFVDRKLGRGSGVKIPVVEFNALAPSAAEQAALHKAMTSVQPYALSNLDKPRQAIEAIFQRMLNDPANYDTVDVQSVETHTKTVKRQGFKRVPREVEETQLAGCRWQVNTPIFSYCHPNKVKVMKVVEVDEPYEFEEQAEVPTEVHRQEQKLRNEEDYYWQMALEEYEHSMSASSSHRKQNKDEL